MFPRAGKGAHNIGVISVLKDAVNGVLQDRDAPSDKRALGVLGLSMGLDHVGF